MLEQTQTVVLVVVEILVLKWNVDSGGNVRSDWVFGADRSFKSVNQNLGNITMGGTTI